MNNVFAKILRETDRERLYDNIENLWKRELPQTSKAHAGAAAYTLELLNQAGIENAEIIDFPADGKTTYQDKCMPLAWEASTGKLTIKISEIHFDDPVVADYRRHSFHLVKGSVATPPGGQMAGIITEAQLFAGEDAGGALVICSPETVPGAEILAAALDMGALGLITDYYVQSCRETAPDAVGWVTACTEGMQWHVQSGDRPFICFSVAARTGDQLRRAAECGKLTALVECDGQRYEGVLPVVTALVPGRQKKEFWLMAHLYEPMSDDNSTGVAGAIEMVRCIKALIARGELPELEFSIRLVFGAELYGFAAFADYCGGFLGDKAIGAVNLDSLMAGNPGQNLHVYAAAPGTPFFGNALLEMFLDDCALPVTKFVESGWYDDDTFLSDQTVGLPTVWFIGVDKAFWHNSALTMQMFDCDVFARTCASIGTWIVAVTTLNRQALPDMVTRAGAYALRHITEEYRRAMRHSDAADRMKYRLRIDVARLNDFRKVADIPEIDRQIALVTAAAEQLPGYPAVESYRGKWFDYVATVIPSRAVTGFPYDQGRVPKKLRRMLPDRVIYGPFSRILSNMDGQKSLQRVIREAEWEEQVTFGDAEIKKYLGAVMYLGDYGYLQLEYHRQVTRPDMVNALRRIGVNSGDCLFVHSSISAFGRIDGDEEAVIDALLEAVGPTGTVLMPTFTMSFSSFEGELNKNRAYRPFDKNDSSQIWVGSVPRAFLLRPGVIRTSHASHSVAGFGPQAEPCLKDHRENDPPAGPTSPFAKLMSNQAKILYFGCGLGASTFLHFLETEAKVPYLKSSVCRVKDENGQLRTVYVPQNLPGDRDFYRDSAGNSKFFSRAAEAGLQISEVHLGSGELRLIDAGELYNTGMKLLAAEPDILLCDSNECMFCRKYRSPRYE